MTMCRSIMKSQHEKGLESRLAIPTKKKSTGNNVTYLIAKRGVPISQPTAAFVHPSQLRRTYLRD